MTAKNLKPRMTANVLATINPMTEIDMAWVAGILEGEGSFVLKPASRYVMERNLPYVKVQMNDEDVINRVFKITGFGKVSSGINTSGTINFVWQSTDRDLVPEFCRIIRPIMGVRRQHQIDVLLAGAKPYGYTTRSIRYGEKTPEQAKPRSRFGMKMSPIRQKWLPVEIRLAAVSSEVVT